MSRSVLVGKRLRACWTEPVMVPSLPVSLVASRGPTNTKVESSPDYSGWSGRGKVRCPGHLVGKTFVV